MFRSYRMISVILFYVRKIQENTKNWVQDNWGNIGRKHLRNKLLIVDDYMKTLNNDIYIIDINNIITNWVYKVLRLST